MAAKSSTPRTSVLSVSARKIKDNAADWHNLMMKWETLNDNGFTAATKIVNIKIATESRMVILLCGKPGCYFFSNNFHSLKSKRTTRVKIHQKMEKLCSTTKGICDLETYHHGEHVTPFFHTWPTPYFYEVSIKLLDMYSNELKLKHTIVQEIAHTTDQDLLMVYLSSWLYQPYIENTSKVLLESMLLETGHRPV
ncbi:hypothetical protein JD844_020675 [Phrynosoma platyrhinos]|uniref:Cyclin-dependent kinase 2-interacting protein n=1 Tax=Phrynosoma platyrhinos TaxID=52577 RepID=A0ABQ7SSK4_PHRPL|nr:hypothetical protein JD844_020675 [Phrynosoma platyrhinos]